MSPSTSSADVVIDASVCLDSSRLVADPDPWYWFRVDPWAVEELGDASLGAAPHLVLKSGVEYPVLVA